MALPTPHTPAKRNPDGFVAQRMCPDDGTYGPWLLAAVREDSGLYVERFTDDAVSDWPDLIEPAANEINTPAVRQLISDVMHDELRMIGVQDGSIAHVVGKLFVLMNTASVAASSVPETGDTTDTEENNRA